MNTRSPARPGGFTLIELLLAIGLFAGVLAAIYACWSGVLRGSRAALDAAAEVQRGRIAQRCIEEALGTAVMFGGNPQYYSFYGFSDGDEAYLSFVARLPDHFPHSGLFGGLKVRRVTFEVERDAGGTRQLVMTQMPILYETNIDQQPYRLVLARNVKLFNLAFYETNRSGGFNFSGSGEWMDAWPYTNRFPTRIQCGVAFDTTGKEKGAAPYVMATVFTLPSVGVAEHLQRANAPGAPGGPPPGTGQSGQTGNNFYNGFNPGLQNKLGKGINTSPGGISLGGGFTGQ